jgi:phage terminase large subunit
LARAPGEHPGIQIDPWQEEALEAFPHCQRIAMKASKGPGKTTVLAWLAINFLLTRPEPNIAATSISADNLRDNLWKEMAIWINRSSLLQSQFEWRAERIVYKASSEVWVMSARPWAKSADQTQLGNTLAGLHADYILFLIDECGAIPPAILASAEGALSSCKEGHIVIAGNTNSLDGALYHACWRQRHLWRIVEINGDPDNPKRSTRISLQWAREQIKLYGRDNPFIKVMVLGEWPSASLNALLGAEDIEQAMRREYTKGDIDHAPRILGVDCARYGDDSSVIFPRQGLIAFKPHVMRNVDSQHGAGQVARAWKDWSVDAVFIDNTGGYGAGWIDVLKMLGRNAVGVGFAEAPHDKRYANRRAEMYFKLARWVKEEGGKLPDEPGLLEELTAMTYSFRGDALLLEPKESIKAKLGRSCDMSDALALTFAAPVAKPSQPNPYLPAQATHQPEYDPFARHFNPGRRNYDPSQGNYESEYDPFAGL